MSTPIVLKKVDDRNAAEAAIDVLERNGIEADNLYYMGEGTCYIMTVGERPNLVGSHQIAVIGDFDDGWHNLECQRAIQILA